jgi:hypothetical protein
MSPSSGLFVDHDDDQIEIEESPEESQPGKRPAEEASEHEREREGAFGPCDKLSEQRPHHHGRSVSDEDRG